MLMSKLLFAFFLMALPVGASEMIRIPTGAYKPLLNKGKSVVVPEFQIQETAVTNEDYLQFVKKNPSWAKAAAKKMFADGDYLSHWKTKDELGPKAPAKAPVTHVSWFAANAYCESLGARLPTVDEWEYLAQFGPEASPGKTGDSAQDVKSIILEWYSKTTPEVLPEVRSTFRNQWKIWDVHGLIWEWNYDFNTTFVTGESRGDTALEKSMFCGSGAVGAADPSDYAAFMRFGFRSSLKANYTVGNLGFRCVKGKL